MGTPEFAEYSLRRMVEEGFDIVGVVTVPDRAIGRHGSVLQPSPVKQYAASQGIPVLQPEKLKDEAFLTELRSLNADLQVVVAFRMLPEVVWSMPRLGTFNLHASLLPQYRGAAPINWAVINGDRETGVTTFFLKHEIDTGDIIGQVRVMVEDDEDAGSVHDKLMTCGADLLITTTDEIISGSVKSAPQVCPENGELRPAPKLFKENCRIDWNRPAETVRNFIRGLAPYPAAWTVLNLPDGRQVDCKVFKASISERKGLKSPGQIHTDAKSYIDVETSDGNCLSISEIQIAGKKRMSVNAFLCGTALSDVCRFE